MVTHYGDLITTARANLATALLRQHHPSATRQPAVPLPAYLADFADALAHLGATIGETSRTDLALLRALRALARVDLDPTGHDQLEPRGPALDLAEATMAVRVAADLIASHGPPAEQLTDRQLAHEWATPRPEHLTTPSARQGAWTQIADLATLTAALVGPEADPLLDDAAQRVADTAAAVPRHSPDPGRAGHRPGVAAAPAPARGPRRMGRPPRGTHRPGLADDPAPRQRPGPPHHRAAPDRRDRPPAAQPGSQDGHRPGHPSSPPTPGRAVAGHPPPAARPAHPDRAADARPEVRADAHPGPGRGTPEPRRPDRRAHRPDPGRQLGPRPPSGTTSTTRSSASAPPSPPSCATTSPDTTDPSAGTVWRPTPTKPCCWPA